MISLLALVYCPLAAALTLRGYEPAPIVFPSGSELPRNVVFHVLWPEGPEATWLEDEHGRRVRATRRRRGVADGRTSIELRPARTLAANSTYCVVVRVRGWTMDECISTGSLTDEAAPTGGAVTGARIAGGEVWLDIEPGVETSATAMEIEVHRGQRACTELAPVHRGYLRFGTTLDFYSMNRRMPGDGTYCFEGLPHPNEAASLRVRWIDAAGNTGAWSDVGALPAGLSASTIQAFGEASPP